jgi:hypothetical protein
MRYGIDWLGQRDGSRGPDNQGGLGHGTQGMQGHCCSTTAIVTDSSSVCHISGFRSPVFIRRGRRCGISPFANAVRVVSDRLAALD